MRTSAEVFDLLDINKWRESLDNLTWKASKCAYGQNIALNLKGISFLRPQGIIMLFLISNQIYKKTQQRIELINVNDDLLRYLERVGLFSYDFIYTKDRLSWWDILGRKKRSLSIVEIKKISHPNEVAELSKYTHDILTNWFDSPSQRKYCDNAVYTIMEVCNNSIEHSRLDGEPGECYFTLQKYTHGTGPEICIATGDIGVGIRTHLRQRHGRICKTEAEYIEKALAGVSGRLDGSGGMGLPTIKNITSNYSGLLAIRSGKGYVVIGDQVQKYEFKHSLPGTQCVINLRPH